MEDLKQQVQEFKKTQRRATFTLEPGRGQTYASNKPTLYGHGVYPRGSVLAGRDLRKFVDQWDTWEEARTALKAIGLKFDDFGPQGGTTHVDIDVVTAGIPDDTDY